MSDDIVKVTESGIVMVPDNSISTAKIQDGSVTLSKLASDSTARFTYAGSGQPNGVVTGIVGEKYIDTDATAGAVEWTKMSGTGDTGWVVTIGDTGWRAVTDLLLNGWLTYADRITIRRQNNVVTLMLGDMDGRSATTDVIMTLPSGFRPNWQYNVPSYTTSGATSSRSVNAVYTGNVTWCGTPRPTYENALFTYLTSDAWPTSLPGTASGTIPS